MAKNLIPEELDALIKEYLTDGVLTDKERQVILKKAEGMKLDRDEIDLYLDAQVQKIDQATDAAVRRQKGKACPHCGAYVSQMTDKCPECGQFITPEATKELEEILDNLEEALINMKSGKDFDKNKAIVERYERKARMYYSSHPKIKALLVEVDNEKSSTVKQAKRNAFINGTIKNLKFWCVFPAIIGLILFFGAFKTCSDASNINKWDENDHIDSNALSQKNDKMDQAFMLGIVGVAFIGVAVGIYNVAEDEKKEKEKGKKKKKEKNN